MIEKFYPYQRIGKIYDFDFDVLKKDGIKGLVFDIDNTLVPDEAPADEAAINLIKSLDEKGFKCLILSNNSDKRVKDFVKDMNCLYVLRAGKPSPKGYLEAMNILGTDKSTTVFFGDQIFTDTLGANRAGVRLYLCEPIDKVNERAYIKLKRIVESLVLCSFNKNRLN